MLVISKEILKCINDAGYKAYMVGGVVRDYLLGNSSIDVDICTSATPKQLLEIFPMAVPHMEYGCVKLFYKEINFEITTFRVEKRYDGRHPVEIEYVTELEKDLSRRDFTINTLCMDQNGNIVDVLGAKTDLEKKILKSVGNPDKKFKEDPLRILRGIRFSANLNFKIEKNTLKAIKNNKKLIRNISYNKKREELDKIFASRKCREAINLIKKLKLDKELELKNISKLKISDNILIIWAQLDCLDMYPFSNNEDKFWIKKINSEDGRTIVKSFSFSEIFEDASAKKENQTIANATSINNVIEQKVNELINVNNVLINKLQNLEDRVHAVEATKQQVPIQQTKVDSKTNGGGQVNNGKQQSQQSFKNDF